MSANSPHTVDTLNERINAVRDVMDERDRRYEQRFQAQEEALKLSKGQIPIVLVISILALATSLIQMLK